MVVMVFVICWMPFYVVQLVNVFAEQDDATVSQLSVILGYANSCANPIIYFFVGSFRHQLKHQTLKMVLQSALQDTPETAENMVEMSSNKAEP